MKAEELMIGDLLQYRSKIAAFDFRVEQITKHKVGYHAEPCENRIHYLRLNEVQPIPLTAKILEKSGFIIGGNGNYICKESEAKYICFCIGEYTSLWGGADQDYVWIRVKYVHELQHALRLCGIEKEIVL